MGTQAFAQELEALGLTVQMHTAPNVIVTRWEVPVGPRRGETVQLGFAVPADYPLTPPSGPCVSPRLSHPKGAVHDAPAFGSDWVYWSRPCQHWMNTTRDARAYLAHVRALFAEL